MRPIPERPPRDPVAEAEDVLVQAEIDRRAREETGPPAPGRTVRYTTGSEHRGWRERQDPYGNR